MANAARRGFIREGSLLVGLSCGLWLAGRFYHQLARPLDGEGGAAWSVLIYFGLLFGLVLAAAALSALAVPLVRKGPLRLLDRLAGVVLGVAEASLVIGLAAMAAERVGALRPPSTGVLARTLDLTRAAFVWLSAAIPPEILAMAKPA